MLEDRALESERRELIVGQELEHERRARLQDQRALSLTTPIISDVLQPDPFSLTTNIPGVSEQHQFSRHEDDEPAAPLNLPIQPFYQPINGPGLFAPTLAHIQESGAQTSTPQNTGTSGVQTSTPQNTGSSGTQVDNPWRIPD